MQLLISEVSEDYCTQPPGFVSFVMLTITYMVASTTIQHVACTGSMVTATSVMVLMKMVYTVSRVGLEPTIAIPGQCATIAECSLP